MKIRSVILKRRALATVLAGKRKGDTAFIAPRRQPFCSASSQHLTFPGEEVHYFGMLVGHLVSVTEVQRLLRKMFQLNCTFA